MFQIKLDKHQELLVKALTRDAWVHFSNLISARETFRVAPVPAMPRNGEFEIPDDSEVIEYYLQYATAYKDEFIEQGWSNELFAETLEALISKIETTTLHTANVSLKKSAG